MLVFYIPGLLPQELVNDWLGNKCPFRPALATFSFVRKNTPGGGVEKILKAFPAFPTPVWRKITGE